MSPTTSLNQPSPTRAATRLADARPPQLTPRQSEVLVLIAEGLTNKMIGERLNIALGTVKIHITHIFRVLNVASRVQAAIMLRREVDGVNRSSASGAERMPWLAPMHGAVTAPKAYATVA